MHSPGMYYGVLAVDTTNTFAAVENPSRNRRLQARESSQIVLAQSRVCMRLCRRLCRRQTIHTSGVAHGFRVRCIAAVVNSPQELVEDLGDLVSRHTSRQFDIATSG
eukprot:Amastigsp_a510256_65.p3 type:complete len:107 gc:universal Amastigsp_a510256_65:340-660(+)